MAARFVACLEEKKPFTVILTTDGVHHRITHSFTSAPGEVSERMGRRMIIALILLIAIFLCGSVLPGLARGDRGRLHDRTFPDPYGYSPASGRNSSGGALVPVRDLDCEFKSAINSYRLPGRALRSAVNRSPFSLRYRTSPARRASGDNRKSEGSQLSIRRRLVHNPR
jgi:hypothetical protein